MKIDHIARKIGILSIVFAVSVASIELPCVQEKLSGVEQVCAAKQANTKLKFKIKTYKYSAKNSNGDVYGTISYQYPVAQGNSKAAQAINRYFKLRWAKTVKAKKDYYKDWPWYSDTSGCEVTCNDGMYVSVLHEGFLDNGAGHGSVYRDAVILNAKTGERITPKEILGISSKALNKKIIALYLQKYDRTGGEEFIVDRYEVERRLFS